MKTGDFGDFDIEIDATDIVNFSMKITGIY
jgi:hypothetical protein